MAGIVVDQQVWLPSGAAVESWMRVGPSLPITAVLKPWARARGDQRVFIQIIAAEALVHLRQHHVVFQRARGAPFMLIIGTPV